MDAYKGQYEESQWRRIINDGTLKGLLGYQALTQIMHHKGDS